MTQLATVNQRIKELGKWFEQPSIQRALKGAIRTNVSPEMLFQFVATQIRRIPKLAECAPASTLGCMIEATQLGLEIGVGGQAYLIPFKGVCTLVVGYRGLVQLAYRSKLVGSIQSQNVYSNEEFTLDWGAQPPIHHKPLPPVDRGDYVGSHCCVRMPNGGVLWDFMWADEIDAIRNRSQAKNNGPWVTDVGEMRRKTVSKRALKYAPSESGLQRAISLDDQVDAGLEQELPFIDLETGAAPSRPQLSDFAGGTPADDKPAAPREPFAPEKLPDPEPPAAAKPVEPPPEHIQPEPEAKKRTPRKRNAAPKPLGAVAELDAMQARIKELAPTLTPEQRTEAAQAGPFENLTVATKATPSHAPGVQNVLAAMERMLPLSPEAQAVNDNAGQLKL